MDRNHGDLFDFRHEILLLSSPHLALPPIYRDLMERRSMLSAVKTTSLRNYGISATITRQLHLHRVQTLQRPLWIFKVLPLNRHHVSVFDVVLYRQALELAPVPDGDASTLDPKCCQH